MLRAIFVIFVMFHFSNASAQRSFKEFVDSTIMANNFSEKDWAIALETSGGGPTLPIFDSLGNEIFFEPESFTTIVIYNIKNVIYLQRFKECYESDTCFHAGKRLPFSKGIGINYTVDSIQQAEKEWIYSYIYKDEYGGYVYQGDSNHSLHYVLTFITRQLNTQKYFTRICFVDSLFSELPKNLNYTLNINTFTYRAFLIVKQFLIENRKLIPVD